MPVSLVGSYTLGEVNVGAAAAVTALVPVLAKFDLALTGGFGLGALQADIAAQLNAALSAQVDLQLQVSNPLAALTAALRASAQLAASISATLALGIPAVSAEVGVKVSASAAISAALAVKLGGIQALIQAALSVKIPAASLAGTLSGHLSAGPVVLLAWDNQALNTTGTQLSSLFAAGVGGILPGDSTYGIVLVTKAPAAWASMQAVFKTT